MRVVKSFPAPRKVNEHIKKPQRPAGIKIEKKDLIKKLKKLILQLVE